MVKLNKEAVEAIEMGLTNGYDVEVRVGKYGITVATNNKKVTYKENSMNNLEFTKEPKVRL